MSADTGATMAAPTAGVKVRMVRQGLGDCFLLAFPTDGPRPVYVLIDCGVLLSAEDAGDTMKKVTASLREATGGKIDVLVATLEHWDHVSGFQQAKEMFDQIEVGQVWAAWTADPNDPAAQRLRARRRIAVQALREAAQELRQCGEEESAGSLESVLGLFGEIEQDGPPSAAQPTMADVLGRGNPPRYLRPGDRPELPGLGGAAVYVLGPPGVEAPLLTPDGLDQGDEQRLALDSEASLGADALVATVEELKSFPFDPYYRVPVDAARQDPFFQASYFGVTGQPSEREMIWRQIETEWLTSASQLPLQLDVNANNASLALAFELAPGGKVLLFASDVQTDNWLSWHHLQWPAPPPAPPVTVADLLHRTVMYKVGHHASHNATLEAGGLELLADPELVVMVPDGLDTPFPPLLQSLEEKAKGRVLRADSGVPAQSPGLSPEEWKGFEERCAVTPDYVELTIAVPAAGGDAKE